MNDHPYLLDPHFRVCATCVVFMALTFATLGATGAETDLNQAKPVPDVQVIPLPYHQASFQLDGRELTRYHFGPSLKRPFWYPLLSTAGRSLTRMGHPHDPFGHRHHNSVWISHHDVGGVDFWGDNGKGRIVHQLVKQYEDGQQRAWMLSLDAWRDEQRKVVLMHEWRRCCVEPLDSDSWLMLIDIRLEAPADEAVTLGRTPFGLIGVRMAKTIGVHDGGGRILNSEGQLNEEQVFRNPARWVDYSGPVTNQFRGGITLMDHVDNPDHPTPFHVRDDGWMGICLTSRRPLVIQPGRPLRLRYGLWVHAGMPKPEQIEQQWNGFTARELPPMPPPK
jgi:hypothetical protein